MAHATGQDRELRPATAQRSVWLRAAVVGLALSSLALGADARAQREAAPPWTRSGEAGAPEELPATPSLPPVAAPPPEAIGEGEEGTPPAVAHGGPGFHAERAFSHLEALAALGPRPTGSPGAERARDYLREALEALGAEVREERTEIVRSRAEPVEAVHLVAELPGDSPDTILLGARYDSFEVETFEYRAANAAASGPALVLELGRALAAGPRPYGVTLAFIDGDALPIRPGQATPAYLGSRALAERLRSTGALDRVRLALFFEKVADPDLQLARDLNSHRAYRERIWETGRELGYLEAFPPRASFDAPAGSHRGFLAARFRRVVALTDDRFGSDEAPGPLHLSEQDVPENCSAESMAVVGRVALEGLLRIQTQLSRIDRLVGPAAAAPSPAP